ncbi:toll/interleukin-1 receptor domain-containing protein [Streptomyces sp. NBC_00433]
MAYDFITSFAARENEAYAARFHEDLVGKLRALTGTTVRAAMCPGRPQDRPDASPAAEAAVMVSLCSKLYYDDCDCGRDWSTFEQRLSRTPDERRTDANAARVLVRWQPPFDPPTGLPRASVGDKGLTSLYALKGLRGIMDVSGWESADYRAALDEIAACVLAGRATGPAPLPPGEQFLPLVAFPQPRPAVRPSSIPPQARSGDQVAREPRIFISYAHEDDGVHAEQVSVFWQMLRAEGIDARLDQPAARAPQDWPQWMQNEYRKADFIVVVASPAYKRRAEGTETEGVGRGVAWEARLLRREIYEHPTTWYLRILRVILPGTRVEDLPDFLGGHDVTHYAIDPAIPTDAELLLDYLKSRKG